MLRTIASTVSNTFKLTRSTCSSTCAVSEVPPNTSFTILENGVRVATEMTNAPLASLSLFVEAGSRFETACNNGITHFVERMAYKGFKGMTKYELDRLVSTSGTKLSAHTDREIQIFSAKCLPEAVPAVIGILASIVTNLELLEQEIEYEKCNIKFYLNDLENDPKAVVFDYLHQTAFQGTPLSNRVVGKSENIQCFDKLTLCNFIHDHYQPYKLALVASGNVMHETMLENAKVRLGDMQGDPYCESHEGPARFTGSQVLFRDDSLPFAHIAIAFEVPGYNSPDYLPLMAAKCSIGTWNKNQGGHINNHSPLAQAADVSHLCEYFEAFYIPYRDIGLWGVYYVSKKMEADDFLYNLQNTWMHMCTTTQFYEVEKALNALRLEFAQMYDGSIRSCHDLGMQILYRCGRKSLQQVYHELEGLNNLNIKSCVEKWIYDRCPAVVGVGPVEGLSDYTRIRAGTYWLRL